jgi:anhydro-N-acetylmuramic acid kinase
MSGTSHDGIDAALMEVGRNRERLSLHPLCFRTYPYPRTVRERLLRLSQGGETTAAEVSQMNFTLGGLFAGAVLGLCRDAGTSPQEIDAIGSHGHTLYHRPREQNRVGSTLQIGEPAMITQRTGITTVADFRPADVAGGGEGAPLVPYVHYWLFHHRRCSLAVHNIGGIANLTYLPAGKGLAGVIAFDSGPGNMVIDGVVQQVTCGQLLYDRNGRLARSGKVHARLLAELLRHPYLKRRPPKSTGREEFGEPFVQRFLTRAKKLNLCPEDMVATATAFTAKSMALAYRDHIFPQGLLAEVLLTGGGGRNPVLREMFAQELPAVRVRTVEEVGYDSKALEALSFGVLAYATLCGLPSNVPSATGAAGPAILGKVIPGNNYNGTRLTKRREPWQRG